MLGRGKHWLKNRSWSRRQRARVTCLSHKCSHAHNSDESLGEDSSNGFATERQLLVNSFSDVVLRLHRENCAAEDVACSPNPAMLLKMESHKAH